MVESGWEAEKEIPGEPGEEQMLAVRDGDMAMGPDPTEELEARIGAILAAIENAERRRARELMVMLFERLAECDPITVAAYKPQIMRTLGIPADTFRGMLGAARKKLSQREGMEAGVARYGIVEGRICAIEFDANTRETVARPLCNFSALIVRENILDQGDGEEEREYAIEGTLEKGEELPALGVGQRSFESMDWVRRSWGLRAQLYGNRKEVRAAIEQLSEGAARRTALAHTGWHEVDGRRVFVHARGVVGGTEEEILVQLDPALERYRLPAGTERAQEGMRASMEMLRIGIPSGQGEGEGRPTGTPSGRPTGTPSGRAEGTLWTLWAAMYLAPLGAFIPLDFVIWLYGTTGTFKSTLLALALSHYGEFTRTTLPANWESTGNALERLLFLAKDVPLAIDDFAPPEREGSELEQKAARVIRAAGNRAGRDRMTTDGGLNGGKRPRGLILCSGEQLPSGGSILARTLPVELRTGEVDPAKLSEAQRKADLLPHAMSGYLAWIAERWDGLAGTLPGEWQKRREELQAQEHLRLPEIYASLYVASDLALRYAVESGAATAEEAEGIRASGASAWQWVFGRQEERLRRERPTVQFLEALRELILRGSAYVDRMGERRSERRGKLLGWEDDDYYYLLPRAAYDCAVRAGLRATIKPVTLYRQLHEEGILVKDPEGKRATTVKWAGHGSHRVLMISKQAAERAVRGE